jgi:general secretion pathway protein C
VEIYLKRYFWVVPIVIITACGVLAARAANHVIEAKLLSTTAPRREPTTPRAKPRSEPKPPPSKDADGVVARNMFCSTCEPPKPPEAATPAAPSDDNNPPQTSLPLALVATIVASDQSASAATIVNTSNQRAGSYHVGDEIPEAGEVKRIRSKWVDFHNKATNRIERVAIGVPPGSGSPQVAAAPAPAPAPATPPPAAEGQSPESDLLAAVDKGVKRVSDTSFDIDRALVDKILLDPSVVARQARIVPSIKDGKANGFKMYAIRPNSVFAKIGLQNGDTIQSINGFDMSSPDKALEVYTKVRSASNLSISILRRGQPVQMEYSIK